MDPESAHTSWWQTSEAMVVVTLALGLALEFLVYDFGPLPLSMPVRITIGVLVILAGLGLIVLARRELGKSDQPAAPDQPTTEIVQSGIYGWTRNPIYAGVVIITVGLGVTFDVTWFVILALPLAIAMQWALILPEERYLQQRFGEDYQYYVSRVRRWFIGV